MNNWQILEIPQGSTQEEIKKAFRKLAHIHHPDKGGNTTKFQEINKAYTELMKGNGGGEKPYQNPFHGRASYTRPDNFWQESMQDQVNEVIRKFHEEQMRKERERMERMRKTQDEMRNSAQVQADNIRKNQIRMILNQMKTGVSKKIDHQTGKVWFSLD